MTDMKTLLERLSNAHGVSGYEGNVRQMIEEEVKPYVDEIKTDRMGNLIATKNGGSPTVMLAAHMDEIGLMVNTWTIRDLRGLQRRADGSTRHCLTRG